MWHIEQYSINGIYIECSVVYYKIHDDWWDIFVQHSATCQARWLIRQRCLGSKQERRSRESSSCCFVLLQLFVFLRKGKTELCSPCMLWWSSCDKYKFSSSSKSSSAGCIGQSSGLVKFENLERSGEFAGRVAQLR